jgi:hypothetical protein
MKDQEVPPLKKGTPVTLDDDEDDDSDESNGMGRNHGNLMEGRTRRTR